MNEAVPGSYFSKTKYRLTYQTSAPCPSRSSIFRSASQVGLWKADCQAEPELYRQPTAIEKV